MVISISQLMLKSKLYPKNHRQHRERKYYEQVYSSISLHTPEYDSSTRAPVVKLVIHHPPFTYYLQLSHTLRIGPAVLAATDPDDRDQFPDRTYNHNHNRNRISPKSFFRWPCPTLHLHRAPTNSSIDRQSTNIFNCMQQPSPLDLNVTGTWI